jgi:protein-disulfide isomerase
MTILDSALLRALALFGAVLLSGEVRAQTAAPAAADAALAMKGYALGDMILGNPDAPVTIVEYSSFTCPHCANFKSRTWPKIKEKYIDTGKAKLIFREVYFDQYGLWASMVARCGGQATFFDKVGAIMAKQQEWARAGGNATSQQARDQAIAAELGRIGRLEGLSAERVQACMTDEPYMLRLLADFQAHSARDNIRSTPTFIINGKTATGDMSVEAFSKLIDEHL